MEKKDFQVSILMGSDSDLPVMKNAGKILEEFGVQYEILVLSAHRTPAETTDYLKNAPSTGVKVVIAGAGGAAHLAGVCAAHFLGPVIGVPIKSDALDGADALYATVQMPPGVPVATVSINGAKNAGLLAVKMLSIEDKDLQKKLSDYLNKQREEVLVKSKKLKSMGHEKYLKNK